MKTNIWLVILYLMILTTLSGCDGREYPDHSADLKEGEFPYYSADLKEGEFPYYSADLKEGEFPYYSADLKEGEFPYHESSMAEPTTVFVLDTTEDQDQSDFETSDVKPKTTAKLLFAGDILLSDHILAAYDQSASIHGVLDEGYRNAITQADYFIANQEFPFSDRGSAAMDKQFTFRLPVDRVHLLQEMNLNLVSLANNHALDYGREALLDTIQTLDQAGILHLGAGRDLATAKEPIITEIGGMKIGFLAATRVIPVADWAATSNNVGMLATYDPTVLLESVSELRSQCDYVVVYVHWGIERAERPEEYQRILGRQYLDAGADLVIGSHPHVLQGIEFYQGKAIVYSLGNFVFGSSIPRTALLQVNLSAEEGGIETTLSLIPGTSNRGHTKIIDDAVEVNEFYQYMEDISEGISFSGAEAIRIVVPVKPES